MQDSVRLNKFLASHGYDARRKIEEFLQKNEVKINGIRIFEPGERLNPKQDEVTINGKPVISSTKLVYLLLNKPKNVISSVKDEHHRQTVVDLVNSKERIYPVGRLDENTKGAIILTNDGELTNQLTHPKFHIAKTYVCLVAGKVKDWQLKALQTGIELKEGKTRPAEVEILEEKPHRTVLRLVIHEGRNHQVKRMLAKIKLELIELKRTAIGPLQLGDLELGKWRELTEEEVQSLKNV